MKDKLFRDECQPLFVPFSGIFSYNLSMSRDYGNYQLLRKRGDWPKGFRLECVRLENSVTYVKLRFSSNHGKESAGMTVTISNS